MADGCIPPIHFFTSDFADGRDIALEDTCACGTHTWDWMNRQLVMYNAALESSPS